MWMLIIQLILNFPSIVKTIREIIAMMRGLNDEDKAVVEEQLKAAIRKSNRDKAVDAAAFEAIKQTLSYKRGL